MTVPLTTDLEVDCCEHGTRYDEECDECWMEHRKRCDERTAEMWGRWADAIAEQIDL